MKVSNLLRSSVTCVSLTLAALSTLAGEIAPPTPTPPPPASIVNLSTRVVCGTRETVAVTEFLVQGEGSKEMLLRGIGPSLHQNGVPGFLRDPNLTLLNADGTVIAYNDNWVDSPDKDAINATGLAPSDDREPAILSSLMPGFYTSVMRGAQNRSGVGVIEAYDLQPPNSSLYIAAIGTRGQVLTGDNVLVSGVILGGPGPVSLLVRTLGPSLATAGLRRVLADPSLYIVSANGDIIASNDNWGDNFNKDKSLRPD